MVNQRISVSGSFYTTPLHLASHRNIQAIQLLLDGGAAVDGCDSNYFTPLECIITQKFENGHDAPNGNAIFEAAVHLIRSKAATGLILSWPSMLLLDNISAAADLPGLLFEQTPTSVYEETPPLLDRTSMESYQYSPTPPELFLRLQTPITDLAEENAGGKSFLHHAICWSQYSNLPPSWNDALEEITPFPWHYHWPNFHKMAFMTEAFKRYRKRLRRATLKRIMNLQPKRGTSPLCRAASRGVLEIMENCLAMNAEIDFEGCSLGSALMIACASGRLDAVKLLVRRGAAISYLGKRGLTSAVLAGGRSERLISCLLVGRFTEQGRLDRGVETLRGSEVEGEVRPWSGIGIAALRLVGRREMQLHESTLDYAAMLSAMKRNMRGCIVPELLWRVVLRGLRLHVFVGSKAHFVVEGGMSFQLFYGVEAAREYWLCVVTCV